MQTSIAVIFWVALGLTLYAGLVYPRLLRWLSRLRRRYDVRPDYKTASGDACRDDAQLTPVSVILPALDDDKQILDRLQNLLEADFPVDRMEIVVGCDAGDDLTGDLAATVNDPRVRVVRHASPRGKTDLIATCLAAARHDVVLLTDCDVHFGRQTIRRLARHFRSPHVGAVCGRLLSPACAPLLSASRNFGEFSNRRRLPKVTPHDDDFFDPVVEHEAQFGVAPAGSGAVIAYQTELVRQIPDGVRHAGLFASLSVYRSGLQVMFEAAAVARRRSSTSRLPAGRIGNWMPGQSGRRPFFVMQQGAGRWASRIREGWLALRVAGCSAATVVLISHWLRRGLPLFALCAMLGNALLAGDPLYLRLLLLHESAYLGLLIHLCLRDSKRWPFRKGALER